MTDESTRVMNEQSALRPGDVFVVEGVKWLALQVFPGVAQCTPLAKSPRLAYISDHPGFQVIGRRPGLAAKRQR